ncbi:unnamed protein product [Didymodactylos carnosus]|uniref:R3H domain-containing protein n=1 Tax=Didymodactylos carnosus TaxID=1234261 RepID=A0A813Z2V2_9BILA|nr:unnamed protein product [Didymodactylos carnosus]CAF3677335.1 unnamed protein product [Didymodactylos carnosus]
MGILKNIEDGIEEPIDPSIVIPHIEHVLNNDTSVPVSSDDDDDDYQPTHVQSISLSTKTKSNRARRQKQILSRIPKPLLQSKFHVCFLLNLAADLDEDFAEVNINDLVDNTVSAFAQLLLNKNKMKMWNEFIDLPEEEQELILKMAVDREQTIAEKQEFDRCTSIELSNSDCSFSNDDSFETFVVIGKTHTNKRDRRHKNIAYSADQRFYSIDSNIRCVLKSMLKRRHLPLARIIYFEDDLIPFFNEHPDSVYVRDLNNGFDRMLLHAVSQYLNLISKSFTRDGERYTQVENHRLKFIPPTTLLSQHIKTIGGLMSHE